MRTGSTLMLAGILACTGCTTVTLEEYTLRQTQTSGEARDRLVLNCLATVAADPDALPPYALCSNGVSTATDSITVGQASTWAPHKRVLENLGLTASRSPKGQWTVDPSGEYQQLEAIHAACLWALFGPQRACEAYPTGILGDPTHYLDGKPHFGVEARLARTWPGWIHYGRLKDVPLHARYKAHKGHTWVWVMPEDSESFAQFTLVLQDIATLEPTIIASPPLLVQLTEYQITQLVDLSSEAGKAKNVTISTPEPPRAVKLAYKDVIDKAIQEGLRKTGKVNLTRAQWLAYTEPWPGVRNSAGAAAVSPATGIAALPSREPTNVLVLPRAPAPVYTVPERTPPARPAPQ